MYKRQIYQIAESNRIEKIYSVARIESNRNFFLPELECSSRYLVDMVGQIWDLLASVALDVWRRSDKHATTEGRAGPREHHLAGRDCRMLSQVNVVCNRASNFKVE